MMISLSRITDMFSAFMVLATLGLALPVQAEDQPPAVNPLRLSYVNGDVSFWRYGASDWVAARVNTPLVAGDALYADKNAELELQAEGRAFIRADDDTQLSLVNQTQDYLQLKVTSGLVSLDLRTLPSSNYTIEVDTPNAVFTIDRTGYYRVEVDGDVHFITRRGGRAMMTPAGGDAMTILPSEEVVVRPGEEMARAETYVAPELDEWDRWNYDRTSGLLDAFSERYLPSGVAGARDLDSYGVWRVSDEYGPVWVPDAVASDWAPYSTGRWVWDPYYQWTWIDDAPWGWAPFHYGRWVYVGGYWAWAPGPVVLSRPVYAPALVAFFGVAPHQNVRVGLGGSGLCWLALGWGEPLVPWWGHSGFVGRPWWGGWGGPRVVNNVVVRQTTVNITNIHYANRGVTNAIIASPAERFGMGHVREGSERFLGQDRELVHIRGALPVKAGQANLVADAPRGVRPPEQVVTRPVVATRRAQEPKLPWRADRVDGQPAETRYVPAPKSGGTEIRRPDVGTQTGPERVRGPMPPRYEEWKQRRAEPVSPAAVVPELNSGGRVDSKPVPITPPKTMPQLNERVPVPQEPVRMPASPERQQQTPRAENIQRQPMRVAPPETGANPANRGGRDFSLQNPVPMRSSPVPVPAAGANERRQRAERTELPGVPANRTYQGGAHEQRERGRHQ